NPAGGGSNGVSLEPQRGGAENRPLLFAVSPPAGGNCDQADANIFLISEEVTGRRASPTRSMLSVFRPPRLARGDTSTSLPSSRRCPTVQFSRPPRMLKGSKLYSR